MERFFERLMYASRWVMAPIYLGLSLILVTLGIKFFQMAIGVFPTLLEMKEVDLILVALALVDLALVGGLIVMVMFSGYENFVSKLDIDEDDEKLSWLGTLDSNSLKNKVSAAIVAISSIHLLKVFMDLDKVDPDKIKWYILIHLTFVASAFAMGFLDKITKKTQAKS